MKVVQRKEPTSFAFDHVFPYLTNVLPHAFPLCKGSFRKPMILTDKKILEQMAKGAIVITPFDRKFLGTNSYDVHLGKDLAVYRNHVLDARIENEIEYLEIPSDGLILLPHRLYLGVTEEYTETHAHVPFLEGKSSVGRLGIDIHATAGKGDVGFCNTWTLEISVKQPVRIYHVETPYSAKPSAKYNTRTNKPVGSMMWKNFLSNSKS
jgi:dCTP deaminase